MANEPTYQEKAKRRPKKKSKEGWTKKKARAVDVAIRKMLVDNEDEGVALEELNAKLSEKERLGPAEFRKLRRQAVSFVRGRVGDRHEEKRPVGLYAKNLKAKQSHRGRRPQNPSEPLTKRVTVRVSAKDLEGLKVLLDVAEAQLEEVEGSYEAAVRLPDGSRPTPPWVLRALLWWATKEKSSKRVEKILKDHAKHVLKGRLAEHATRKKKAGKKDS